MQIYLEQKMNILVIYRTTSGNYIIIPEVAVLTLLTVNLYKGLWKNL
jgi:hypothetical protein